MSRSSERVSFVGGTGFKLAGIIDIPTSSPKASVIFTHCFTCSKDLKAIVRVGRGLAELGYLVLRYDLTGLGNSEGDFSKTNFSTNRADLRAAARFMAEHYSAPSFLIGHSFGGACSLSMAEEIASVRAVVALASPSDTTHLADLLLRMNPKIGTDSQGEVTIGGRSYLITEQMIADFRAFDLPTLLRRLQKPTMLIHSPVDETLGFDHALRLYGLLTQRGLDDGISASPTSLICLPDADHLLVRNPADLVWVTQLCGHWFDRVLSDHAS